MTTKHFENKGTPKEFTTIEACHAFNIGFLDEALCRQWVLKQIHGDEPRCPVCRHLVSRPSTFFEGKRIKCRSCSKFFTALTGTFLSFSQLGFREVFLLAVLLGMEQTNQNIARALHVDQETIRLWRLKFDAVLRRRRYEL